MPTCKGDQTTVTESNDKLTFKTIANWDDPETPLAKVKFDDLDQSSLTTENVEALRFLKEKLGYKLEFEFLTEKDCGRAEDGKYVTILCDKYLEEDKMITFTPMKEYHPVDLTFAKVTAVFETRKEETLAGFDQEGNPLTKNVYKNLVTYSLVFASNVDDETRKKDPHKYRTRYLIYKFEYEDIPSDDVNSCQINLLEKPE